MRPNIRAALRWVSCAAGPLQLADGLLNSQNAVHAKVTIFQAQQGPLKARIS